MIGRQLDLFGGPPKPPKNIVIEDEPVVPEPEILAPDPIIPELITADAEPENTAEPVQESAGVHVQMPVADYEEPSFLAEETHFAADQEIEAFKLNESLEDYTLEEAIAAELVADEIPESNWEAGDKIVAESGVEKEEVAPSDWVPELPDSEPFAEETALEDPAGEEPGADEPGPEEPVLEEPTPEEQDKEEPAPAFLQAETEPEAGEAMVHEVSVSEHEVHEALDAAIQMITDEPDLVTGEQLGYEPSLAQLERLDEIPEESIEKIVSVPEPELVEEMHETVQEVSAEATEAEPSEGSEVGPLNIPSDQALYSRQYYTMRETANMFNVNQSLLRFWENEFDILKPKKNRKGDRYFRPDDIKNLELIYHLLRVRKFTISGAKDYLKNKAKSLDTFVMVQRLEKLKLFLQELKTHA